MKYTLIAILLLMGCKSYGQVKEYLNQPVYLLDTLLYEHNAIIPANTWYTLKGKFPIWDKIEFMPDGRTIPPAKPLIEAETIEKRQYGDGTTDTVCCGSMRSWTTYHGNLIMSSTDHRTGETRAVRWNDAHDMQQHIRKVRTNFPSYVTYYTVETINLFGEKEEKKTLKPR
jgi:hypothetical protein